MDTRRHGSGGHLRSLSQVPTILDTTSHLSASYDVHSHHPNPDSHCFLSKYFKSLQILPISILASLQSIPLSRPSSLLKMDKNLSPSLKYAKTNHIFLFYLNSVLSSCPARLWGYPVLITIGFIPPLPQGSVMVLGPRALPKYPQLWAPTVAMEIFIPRTSGPGYVLPPGHAGTHRALGLKPRALLWEAACAQPLWGFEAAAGTLSSSGVLVPSLFGMLTPWPWPRLGT